MQMKIGFEEHEKSQIKELRQRGASYGIIAQMLGCKPEKVASYCRRRGINGCAFDPANAMNFIDNPTAICKQCGGTFKLPLTGRKRMFCSTKCKDKWWSKNKDKLRTNQNRVRKCLGCDEYFTPASDKRKYCSMLCYHESRWIADGQARSG